MTDRTTRGGCQSVICDLSSVIFAVVGRRLPRHFGMDHSHAASTKRCIFPKEPTYHSRFTHRRSRVWRSRRWPFGRKSTLCSFYHRTGDRCCSPPSRPSQLPPRPFGGNPAIVTSPDQAPLSLLSKV